MLAWKVNILTIFPDGFLSGMYLLGYSNYAVENT